jgi:uncharacterized membrane protein
MPEHRPAATARLLAVDALRGLIMMAMALDHARAFVARAHPFEYWGAALPQYSEALPFVTRLVTHLCAPGFFFLMGVGMTLFATARRRAGWPARRIARYFVTRGTLLLVVEQLIENPAWILGMMGAARNAAAADSLTPSNGGGPMLVFGVLFALGASMIVWSTLVHAASAVVLGVSCAAILVTQFFTPAQSRDAVAFAPLLRLLLIPGRTGIWFVLYPIIPWLGLTGLGIVLARSLPTTETRAGEHALGWGVVLLALFVAVRAYGGFGNIHVPVPSGWIGFLNVTKYPPSLAFVLLTLGVNLLLLSGFGAVSPRLPVWGAPLLTFGRTALFFYIVHLYLYALVGFGFPHGASIPVVYPVWAVGLLILYPLCTRYERFKFRKPADSFWRFF